MSDAARLASQSFSNKPSGVSYDHFTPSNADISAISSTIDDALVGSAYAAALSYAEAISGLQKGSISWSIVRLYYSCFYSLRAMLILNRVIPFNCSGEMLLDIQSSKFLKGGKSSHHWNWVTLRKIPCMNKSWFLSSDSQEAYESLRKHRENVNYTHGFTDPDFHRCLISGESDLGKRFRSYRDDDKFIYTYLADHLAIAYPTMLIHDLDKSMRKASVTLPKENIDHLKRIWSIKDKCPLC
ncbi:hypothetical protein QNZ44_002899 [Enterobacter kobei]